MSKFYVVTGWIYNEKVYGEIVYERTPQGEIICHHDLLNDSWPSARDQNPCNDINDFMAIVTADGDFSNSFIELEQINKNK